MTAVDQDLTVKYDGRGWRFNITVNTNEHRSDILPGLQKAVQGQKLCACVIGVAKIDWSKLESIFAAAREASPAHRHDLVVRWKHGWRFDVVVNTDEPFEEIVRRAGKALRGAYVIAVEDVTREELEKLFAVGSEIAVAHYMKGGR